MSSLGRPGVGRRSISSQHLTSNDVSSYAPPSSSSTTDLRPLPQSFAPLASFDQAQAIPFDKSILTIPHKKDMMTIKAIIVGAGIGGLCLALMMELAGIEYEILERMTSQEPHRGTGVALGPPVLRLFEQMGLLDQIEAMSKPMTGLTTMDKDRRKTGRLEATDSTRYGYPYRLLHRHELTTLLRSRVPASHIHHSKLVTEIHQNPNGASVKCADGSTYYGDIIVGADGADSLVRERMLTALKEQNKLPEADLEPTHYEQHCIGGLSPKLKVEEFPVVGERSSEFRVQTAKDDAASLWYIPLPGNRVAWHFFIHNATPKVKHHPYSHSHGNLDRHSGSQPYVSSHSKTSSSSNLSSSSSMGGANSKINLDWLTPVYDLERPDLQELLNSPCCIGPGTVRDFVSRTPRADISSIDISDRIYKTWYSGRIVLLGDACHSTYLMGGQGALQAILDGVCLVNLLHDMEYNSPPELAKAFKKYHAKRYPVIKGAKDDSTTLEKLFHDKGFMAGVMRKMLFNTMWTLSLANDKYNNNRPQLSFLNFVEDRGTSKANRQKVSARLLRNRTYALSV
ncbi:hypothetical protein DFQ27_005087 [Actinomortierella ambigua]|uniref:FAD-binding domain-containing protein n=1 Tax=Actinomortierella ambigua TaxID=1343610 RepID=A0A9P6U3D3_9FUNG|nr:hypothetical protein DFQ27_005087 [Actinomortierella ambigua]